MALFWIPRRTWSPCTALTRFNHTLSQNIIPKPSSGAIVHTKLNFFDAVVKEPNTFRWSTSNQAFRPSNFTKPDTHDVTIHDLRGHSMQELDMLGLDFENAGFQFQRGWGPNSEALAVQWANQAWKDVKWVETEYYAHVERYVHFIILPKYSCVPTSCIGSSKEHFSQTPRFLCFIITCGNVPRLKRTCTSRRVLGSNRQQR